LAFELGEPDAVGGVGDVEVKHGRAFESEDLADLLGIAPAALKKTIQATIPRRSRAAKAEAAEPDWL
jgi:hypothetical protein